MKATIAAVRVLATAFGQRAMTLIALVAGIAVFGGAVYEPNYTRIAAAVLYALLVFIPLAWIDARRQ